MTFRSATRGLPATGCAALLCAAFASDAGAQGLDGLLQQLGGRNARQAVREAQGLQRSAQQAGRVVERQDRERTCAKITEWLSNIDSLPLEIQQRRFGGARPGAQAGSAAALQIPYESWLLEDARFVPTFGQPFDALPADERERLQHAGNGCQAPRNARGQATADNTLFYRAFLPQYFPVYAQGVKAIRATRLEIDTARKELPLLSADARGFERYRELAAKSSQWTAFMGEAERAQYKQLLTSANERVAQSVYAERGRRAAAQASGYDGLMQLVQLQSEMTRDGVGAAAMPPEVRSRQSELSRELVAQERGRIDALGDGTVGLERGVQWYRDYQTRYEKPAAAVAELREMLTYFGQRRAALLDASQAELSQRIRQTRSESEVQALLARYIPLEMDQRRPSGTAVATSAAQWRDELDKRRVLGSSAVAATEAPPATQTNRPRAETVAAREPVSTAAQRSAERVSPGEPTESEMYDLVKSRFDNAAAEVRQMADSCKGGFSNDAGKAIMCLAGGMAKQSGADEAMRITRFEKLGCERANGKPGYTCDYLVATSGGATRGMGASVAAMVGRGGAAQGRFLKTREGWIAFFGEDERR
jgi:hypothetical protein